MTACGLYTAPGAGRGSRATMAILTSRLCVSLSLAAFEAATRANTPRTPSPRPCHLRWLTRLDVSILYPCRQRGLPLIFCPNLCLSPSSPASTCASRVPRSLGARPCPARGRVDCLAALCVAGITVWQSAGGSVRPVKLALSSLHEHAPLERAWSTRAGAPGENKGGRRDARRTSRR